MSILPNLNDFLEKHTFGRGHTSPAPPPSSMTTVQAVGAAPPDGGSTASLATHTNGLPHDFDQLVRSIGEW